MARRATWIVLLALLLAPIVGGGAVAPVFAQDGNGDQTAVTDPSVTTDEATPDDATPDAEPTEEPTLEATPTDTATPTEEATPTDAASPTDEATPTEEATATEVPSPTATPTNTPKPTKTPKTNVAAAEVTSAATPKAKLVTTAADVEVTINCTSNPEKIRVTNNGKASIVVLSIGSIYGPISAEPVAVNKKIWAGDTRQWLAGPTAEGASKLIDRLIFKDSVYEKDGVIVETSVGTIQVNCPGAPPTTTDQIAVTINCTSDPEKIRVTNNGATQITVKSITTLYQPAAPEPFAVNTKLNPTRTQLWTSGEGATGHVLTKNYILTNSVYDKEGVKVVTSAGSITVRCPEAPPDPFGGAKWIEVNLSTQYLIAWQNGVRVNETYVSTGRPGFETPTGTWYVNTKIPLQDMSGCIQGECYYVPDVPWVMYFTDWGHALHGAYWHNNFGHVMSHGCVNLPVDFSEWLYNWTPIGTPVVIHY